MKKYNRLISIDKKVKQSFFLWGSRQCGKSTLLNTLFPTVLKIDLLKSDVFAKYAAAPHLLREETASLPRGSLIIIDEFQKIPVLLDEVHGLIENQGLIFALLGSSTRKLRRSQANLLGGRAIRRLMYGFVSLELGSDFSLQQMLNQGYLPPLYLCPPDDWKRQILSYVGTYLQEEVESESQIRNLVRFSRFLECAALSDTETVTFSTFARDLGISAQTVREYFSILEDSHMGSFLPAYTKRPKRRTVMAPKFYFHDVGFVNHLAHRGTLTPGGELWGKAFENWMVHEIRSFNEYQNKLEPLFFWKLTGGREVDLIIGHDAHTAIEIKSSQNIQSDHLKGLREWKQEYPETSKCILIYNGDSLRKTEDGIEIMPATAFIQKLWAGEIY